MNKFSKLLKALYLILQKPYLLNNVLKDEIVFKEDFQRAFPSVAFKQIRLVDLMESDEVTITPYAFLSGSSLATDFALLQLLCRKYQVKDYLEIGTWRGESAANVAPYVDSVTSFNLGDEQLLSLVLEKNYVDSHRFFSKDIPNIQEYRDMKIIAIQRMLQLGMLRKDIAKTIGVTYKTLWTLEKEEVKNSDLIINFNKYVLENRYPVKIKTKLKWIKL